MQPYKSAANFNKNPIVSSHPFKATIKGYLEFGKSYETMLGRYQARLEQVYKNDFLLKNAEYFCEETRSIVVGRQVVPCGEKTWKTTDACLSEIVTFAIAGRMTLQISNDKNEIVQEKVYIPTGDRAATSYYLNGCKYLANREADKAIEAFTNAIEKFERYAQAYERRGAAYLQLGKCEDALIDFAQSLSIRENSEAHLGIGEAKAEMGAFEAAFISFDTAIKTAAPFEPIFWTARRIKGAWHLRQGEYAKADFELKLVTKRAFAKHDPNYAFRKEAWLLFGDTLKNLNRIVDAKAAYKEALNIEKCATVENRLAELNGTKLQAAL